MLDRLSDILKTNLNKVRKKGALITLVGSPDDAFTGDTEYSKRINDLKNKIAKMNDKLRGRRRTLLETVCGHGKSAFKSVCAEQLACELSG